jgi:hypothetical protein
MVDELLGCFLKEEKPWLNHKDLERKQGFLGHLAMCWRERDKGVAVGGVDEDCLGNYWSTLKPDEKAFHYARNGDHLLAAFECAFCVFSKFRPGEKPDLTNENDTLLLAAIRRVNLDSFWS